MRKLLFFLCIAAACVSFRANAQTFKFAHVNTEEILQILAERDSIVAKMEKTQKELQIILEESNAELQKKEKEFNDNQNTWSEVVKESKQGELVELYRRVQTQQQNAQARLQQEQQKLIVPIHKKLKDAVDKVGKSNGFTYVFDISAGNPMYVNETQSADVSALVKKELGISK
jgi:outer membrane protein